ncbi:MAG: At rich interactive domain [Cyphobasidiales sp. Tagirdzhanova-0007]|nr:MAG: At rich interactive domain [Cyphobasidiales sp. Tagirdzhanova-0007]
MFASLGANQAQPVSLPEPPLQQQQSGQSQGQPFHPTPGFNAQLHAAFQQLQQSHNAAPPPSQGFATPQLQHQQSQQGAVAGQLDANVLFKLRQSGMQLTPEQQALLSRAMMRRGALAEGQPGQSQHGQGPIHALNAQQALQNQLYQQSQIPPGLRQTSQLPMASTPLGLSNMQPAHSMQQQQQQKQQQQQVTHHPSQPHQSGSSPAGPIPVNILQEFTGLSEQMRNLTSQEQHLSICLAQNLNIILQKTAPGQHAPAPQPLTQGQRTAIQKQLENTRRMLNSARDTLARLEAEHGGKENIIAHLKNFAQQRQAAQQQLQNHAQTQNQLQGQISSQMQQQQQGLQPPPPQLSGLVNRAQMMTPMQAQTQGQPTPPSANRSLLAAGQNEPRAMQAPLTAADKMHHQAQLERYIAMQKHQKQQGQPPLANMNINETSSPNMAARSLAAPPAGLASPATGTMAMQSQQQQQPPPFQSQGSQNQASQQILRDAGAAAAINEEILKTLSAAGPNAFRKALLDTMMKRGTPISSAPMVDDKIIDLVKLYNVVQQRGGCQHVRQHGLWRQIALDIEFPVNAESAMHVSQSLSSLYADYLEPFEEIQRKAAIANYKKQQAQNTANNGRQQVQGGYRQPSPQPILPQNSTNFQIQQQQHSQNQQQYLQNMQHLQQQAQKQHAANTANNQQLFPPNPQQQFSQGQQYQNPTQLQSVPPSPHLSTQQATQPTFPWQQNQTQTKHQRIPSQPQQQQQQESTPLAPAIPFSQHGQTLPLQQRQGQPPTRPPGLPPQEEINRARVEIEQMKSTLLNLKPHYERIAGIEHAEQDSFIHAVRGLAPMVDKVIELLPVYLAISRQPEGTRRLLIMMFMFKDQFLLLDRREFILRLHDLDKLRHQMQLCWSYVTAAATGSVAGNGSPFPQPANEIQANVGSLPAPPAENAVGQAMGQGINAGIGIEGAGFPAATMKAGLRMEDLKPPRPKHRHSGSIGGTPAAIVVSPEAASLVPVTATGMTYASPISVDSPSPAKSAETKAQAKLTPAPAIPGKKAPNTGTAPSMSIAKTVPKGRGKAKQAVQSLTDISVPDGPSDAQSVGNQPAAEATQQSREQQQVSLKRKRELEDAQNDPAGFSERIFASYLSTISQQKSSTVKHAEATDFLSAELLSFLNTDLLQDIVPSEPTVPEKRQKAIAKADKFAINFFLDDDASPSFHGNLSSIDGVSIAPETPEFGLPEDPTKTSPPDHDSVGTPSDSHPLSSLHSKAHTLPSSTNAILSSFDQEG